MRCGEISRKTVVTKLTPEYTCKIQMLLLQYIAKAYVQSEFSLEFAKAGSGVGMI